MEGVNDLCRCELKRPLVRVLSGLESGQRSHNLVNIKSRLTWSRVHRPTHRPSAPPARRVLPLRPSTLSRGGPKRANLGALLGTFMSLLLSLLPPRRAARALTFGAPCQSGALGCSRECRAVHLWVSEANQATLG